MAPVIQLTEIRNKAIERQLAECMKKIQKMLAEENKGKRSKKTPSKTRVVLHTVH